MPPKKSKVYRIPKSKLLKVNQAVGFEFDLKKDKRLGFVIRTPDGLRAYVNECRHIPIPLDGGDADFLTMDSKFIFCRNHGAMYSPLDGKCQGGPCDGKSLHPLEVREEGTDIFVTIPHTLPARGE